MDDVDRLRESWRDLAFGVMKAIGIVALVKRLGLTLKPWAAEREAQERAPGSDERGLTWTCMVCHTRRPDANIAVASCTFGLVTVNIRYCRDVGACRTEAEARAVADAARFGTPPGIDCGDA